MQQPIVAVHQPSSYSLKEVRKLFKTGGYDFDQVIPMQVRQQLSRECANGKRIEFTSLKQLATEYVNKG